MEHLTKGLDTERGWTITSGGWNLLKNQECWEGHKQALITTIRKKTKRTEELEEAINITNVGSMTSTAADQ